MVCAVLWLVAASGAAPGEPVEPQVNVLVVGDLGFSPPEKRTPDQQNTARAMAAYAGTSRLAFDAALVGGDSFKVKLAGPDDPQFREGFEEIYDRKALSMPFYAVLGNHDCESKNAAAELAYAATHPDSRWKMPGHWYRLDLPAAAPLVTVLMLDSNRDAVGKEQWKAQLRWMDEELSKPRQSAWTICLAHHPLFSDGQHGDSGTLQAAWGPLLKKHKVDFYLSGHDHILQHIQAPDWPTTFIVSGGGGENTKRAVAGKRGPFLRATHGFAALQFGARSAKVSLIDDTGAVLHVFERDRSGDIRIVSTTPSDKP
ncbi:MAG: metallophosphoesterase [Planctomycetota bacterium]|nr:metallophosphoesterase [Planctomycetota bacterium]